MTNLHSGDIISVHMPSDSANHLWRFIASLRALSHLVGPGGNGFITATAAACWLAKTAAP